MSNKINTTPPPRAQNFSVSNLQHREDRSSASVSANRAFDKSNGRYGATTSINRVGQSRRALSSISHVKEQQNVHVEHEKQGLYTEDADDKRYDYIRRKVIERVSREKVRAEKYFKNLTGKNNTNLSNRDRVKYKIQLSDAVRRGVINQEQADEFKARVDTF